MFIQKVLAVVVGLTAFLGVVHVNSNASSSASNTPTFSVDFVASARADRQLLLLDTELVIPNDGSQDRQFSITSRSYVNVQVQGLRDADKGFDVLVFSASEYLKYLRDEQATYIIREVMVRGSNRTELFSAGDYYVVIHNRYNILRSMVVNLQVIQNP